MSKLGAASLKILTSTQFCIQFLDLIAHKLLSLLQNAKKNVSYNYLEDNQQFILKTKYNLNLNTDSSWNHLYIICKSDVKIIDQLP